jgi:DNA-binding CsgD family transcriptional regulator
VKTVDTHRLHIKEKLDLRSAPEMIQRAVQWVERETGGG